MEKVSNYKYLVSLTGLFTYNNLLAKYIYLLYVSAYLYIKSGLKKCGGKRIFKGHNFEKKQIWKETMQTVYNESHEIIHRIVCKLNWDLMNLKKITIKQVELNRIILIV